MATKILNSRYGKYDGKSVVSADELFVEVEYAEGLKKLVPITSLYVKLNTKKIYGAKTRKVKSYSDFVAQLKKDNVFTDSKGMQKISSKTEVKVELVEVPKTITTISKDIPDAGNASVSHSFKRDVAIKEGQGFDFEKGIKLLVEIDGKKELVDPREIFFYNKDNYKIVPQKRANIMDHSDSVFYTKDGRQIDMIYTEKSFIVDEVVSSESVDFEEKQETTDNSDVDLETLIKQEIEAQISGKKPKTNDFEVEFNGERYKINLDESHNVVNTVKLAPKPRVKYFSEQEYVVFEEKDPNDPKKKIQTSMIRVRNFEIKTGGEYYQLRFNGSIKMVKPDELTDENGNKVDDIRKFVGKTLQIKVGEGKVLTSDPITDEQSIFTYSVVKTFKEVAAAEQGDVTKDTYLRLDNGEYIKELEVVKPKSFKLVNDEKADFDAYVVQTKDGSNKVKYVVVGKDYFAKHGDSSEISLSKAYRIKRCEMTDKDCSIIQTTSSGKEVEQCAIVQKTAFCDAVAEDAKAAAYESVMAEYKEGKYKVNDVYYNGELQELSSQGKRYVYSDITWMPDYADSLSQYKSLKTNNIRIVNGELTGGPTYSIKKGIKNGFKNLGKFFVSTYGIALMAGVLIPVAGPIIAAAHVVACAAMIPAIPLANVIYGTIKNHKRSEFEDKTELNRQHLIKELEAKIQALYERQTTKGVNPYSEARFEDEYSKLINEIIMLSASTVNNNIKVENGEVKVTPTNVNAAKQYMLEFNEVASQLKRLSKRLEKVKIPFEQLDAEVKRYEAEQLTVPANLMKKYKKAKQEFDECNLQYSDLLAKQQGLMNFSGNPTMIEQDDECERLLKLAQHMRTAVYLQTFKDNPVVDEALNGKGGLYDCSDLFAISEEGVYHSEFVAYKVVDKSLGLTKQEMESKSDKEITDLLESGKIIELDPDDLALYYKNLEREKEIASKKPTKKSETEEEIVFLREKEIKINPEDLMLEEEGKLIKHKADKKLIEEFRKAEDKVEFIKRYETKKAGKMLSRMKFDVKRGLTIDGMPVDLDDEQISRSPAYAKGYQWAKVKQAIAFVHNGIKKDEDLYEVSVTPIADEIVEDEVVEEVKDEVVDEIKDEIVDETIEDVISEEDKLRNKLIELDQEYGFGKTKYSSKTGILSLSGSLKNTIKTLIKKMNRLTELARKVQKNNHLSQANKKEFNDLKFFFKNQYGTIKKFIKERDLKSYGIDSELYNEFSIARDNMSQSLKEIGAVVNADGTFELL